MLRLFSSGIVLGAILLLALAIRLPAIGYGLPYHVFGDEEANVYGAMRMLELRTLLPVLHPDEFKILYEPPLLAYLYAAVLAPVVGVLWVAQGFPPVTELSAKLVLDPTPLWLLARAVMVLLSLGSIYLLYRIGKHFWNETTALFGALFFALSFFETTLASTTRHWAPATFFSLLSLYLLLRAFETHRRFLVILAGAALGCAFGVGYLVFYAPFIAGLIVWRISESRGGWREKIRLFFPTGSRLVSHLAPCRRFLLQYTHTPCTCRSSTMLSPRHINQSRHSYHII